ncbi:MAG: hypothetical protein DRP90_01275 [Planctomycetota bacterium]|nr:MAG: hypothetical protein DRP90_01275 [Planctomycetota bacterium]
MGALRKENCKPPRKNFISRMFGWMLPKGPRKLELSKMNMMGMGASMMKGVMRKQNLMDRPPSSTPPRTLEWSSTPARCP